MLWSFVDSWKIRMVFVWLDSFLITGYQNSIKRCNLYFFCFFCRLHLCKPFSYGLTIIRVSVLWSSVTVLLLKIVLQSFPPTPYLWDNSWGSETLTKPRKERLNFADAKYFFLFACQQMFWPVLMYYSHASKTMQHLTFHLTMKKERLFAADL